MTILKIPLDNGILVENYTIYFIVTMQYSTGPQLTDSVQCSSQYAHVELRKTVTI